MDVFRCLAMGYDATATAKRLQVSWNTVRTHTRNVYASSGSIPAKSSSISWTRRPRRT